MIDVVKDIETVEAMKNYEPEDWMKGYSRGYDEDYSMTRVHTTDTESLTLMLEEGI